MTHTVGSTREEVGGIPQPQYPRVFKGAVSEGFLSRFSSCSWIKKLYALLTIFLGNNSSRLHNCTRHNLYHLMHMTGSVDGRSFKQHNKHYTTTLNIKLIVSPTMFWYSSLSHALNSNFTLHTEATMEPLPCQHTHCTTSSWPSRPTM